MLIEFSLSTQEKIQLINITSLIEEKIQSLNLKEGIINIFLPHSTAALILTEDEPNLKQDWINFLQKLTSNQTFYHNQIDNNAAAHLLSGLLGQNKTLVVQQNKLQLGTWQDLFLVELDGPKERKIMIYSL